MPRRAALFAPLLLLAGCTTNWERPGTAAAETDRVDALCWGEARRAVPPFLVTRLVSPERVETLRDCRTDAAGRQSCTTRTRFVPASYATDDLNAPARREAQAGCMRAQGFVANGTRLLRP